MYRFRRSGKAEPLALSGLAVTAAAVIAAVAVAGSPAGASTTTSLAVYLSPTGTGTACTAAAPCASLSAALAVAADGATVTAAGGDYGSQKQLPRPAKNGTVRNVTITSAPGETATFGSTTVSVPGLTFTDVSFDGVLRVNQGPTMIDNVTVVGGAGTGTITVRGSYVTVQNSLISGGYAHDGINITGSPNRIHDVLIQHNTVRDIGGDTSSLHQHPDCIQIFDSYNVDVRQNDLYDCYNSAITFSPGAHRGIDHVTVESNFLQGCLPVRQRCGNGGSSMDLRIGSKSNAHLSNILVDHNTFGSGSLRLPYQSGVSADHNIVGYLSVVKPCTTALTDSLIGNYPVHLCRAGLPGQTTSTSSGNVSGTVTFVDADNGDLHLTGPAPRIIGPATGGNAPTSTNNSQLVDIDGQTLASSIVGADQ